MRSTTMLVVVLTLVCLISALALALVNSLTEDRIDEQKRLAELAAVKEAFGSDIESSGKPQKIPGALLFSVKVEVQGDLDNGVIPESLRHGFKDDRVPLSNGASISVEETGVEWLITDGKKAYIVKKQEDELSIFEPKEVYLGKKGSQIQAVAFTSEGMGYGGSIRIMMAVDRTGKLEGIEILPGHQETPGLGANIGKSEFKKQFKGKTREGSLSNELEVVKPGKVEGSWQIEALTGASLSPEGVKEALNKGLEWFDKNYDQISAKAGWKGGAQ